MSHNITDHHLWAQAKRYYPDDSNPMGYVYGIFDQEGTVLYIGQTKNIEARMSGHSHVVDEDVQVLYIEVPREELSNVEAEYILHFLPPLNKTFPKSTSLSTLDAYNKVDRRFYNQRVLVLSYIESMGIKGKHGYFRVKDLEQISAILPEAGE